MQETGHSGCRLAKLFIESISISQTMPVSGKVLEDSIRLSKIRRIKLGLYVVQTGALLGFSSFVVFVFGGARLTPTLFMPIPSLVAVVILLLLIMCVESFFFRILEIRFARSSSARHLMAKNSMKRGLLIALVAGISALILAVPSIHGTIEEARSDEFVANALMEAPSFFSSDALGLMRVASVKVTAPVPIDVYLVKEEVYNENKGDLAALYSMRINQPISQFVVNGELTIKVPGSDHEMYYLILNDMENPDTSATIQLVRSVSDTFTGLVMMLLIALVVVNVAWYAYLIPIERKYSAGSIYR